MLHSKGPIQSELAKFALHQTSAERLACTVTARYSIADSIRVVLWQSHTYVYVARSCYKTATKRRRITGSIDEPHKIFTRVKALIYLGRREVTGLPATSVNRIFFLKPVNITTPIQ